MNSPAINVSDADFETEVIQSNVPVLIDFWAPWCAPCKALTPVIDELAEEFAGRAKIVKIDIEENPETAQRYGIRGIPYIVVVVNGEIAKNVSNIRTKTSLSTIIEGYIGGSDNDEVLLGNLDDLTLRQEFFMNGDIDRLREVLENNPHYVNEEIGFNTTPISMAIFEGKQDRIDLLLEYGADLSISNLAGLGYVQQLVETLDANPKWADEPELNAVKALFSAIRAVQFDAIDVLLAHGGDLNARAENGRPYLLFAVLEQRDIGVVNHLVEKGLDLHLDPKWAFEILKTAVAHDNTDLLEYLLGQGVDAKETNEQGENIEDVIKANPDLPSQTQFLEILAKHSTVA